MNITQAAALTCGRGLARTPTFFRLFLPYLYQRIEVPGRKHAFLPLNRDYQPLGFRRVGDLDYASVIGTHAVYLTRDPTTFADVWWNVRGDDFWLYDDNARSRITYFERFERLLQRQMEMVA